MRINGAVDQWIGGVGAGMKGWGGLLVLGFGLSLAGCRSGQPGAPGQPFGQPVGQQGARQGQAGPSESLLQNDAEPRPGRRRSRRGKAREQGTPGQFDFYLLNVSWSPEFCATHQSPECGRGLGFVVHGLWPQDVTGDYPEDCSDAPGPANPGADTDIFPTESLVGHEWQTHGTCSGLGAEAYFAAVHTAFGEVKLPDVAGLDGAAPSAFLARLQGANPGFPAGSFALSCGNNRLTAVEVCLDKGLKPEACQGVRSCGANAVKVTGQ